jgi:hypothetical protein
MSSWIKAATITFALAGIGIAPARADHDVFLGWSADRSYFVKAAQNPMDKAAFMGLTFCSEDEKPTWPKELASERRAPIYGSPGACVIMYLPKGPITVDQARPLVKARAARKGPKGETVTIKLGEPEERVTKVGVVLTVGKTKLEHVTDYIVGNQMRDKVRITDVFWRPDGKQVAFYVDTNPSDETAERWLYVWNYAKDQDEAKAKPKGKAK